MGKHDQRGTPRELPLWVCEDCKVDNCAACIDVMRSAYSDEYICPCRKSEHGTRLKAAIAEAKANGADLYGIGSVEPNTQQILDPETGAVHAPGLTVTQDGEVIRRG